MIIGVAGSQCLGKSTFVQDFIKARPMYTTPENTYRDVLKEKGLKCNQETTPETQTLLMNCIVDQVMYADRLHDMIITDRTPYDVLAYSLWAHGKGLKGFDEAFIQGQIALAREVSSCYSIILHVPICKENDVKIVEDDLRDTDPIFREEIDNIFSAIFGTYIEQQGPFFKWDDCPMVTQLFGSREERIEIVCGSFGYVNKDGVAYGEEESLVADVLAENAGDISDDEAPDIIL